VFKCIGDFFCPCIFYNEERNITKTINEVMAVIPMLIAQVPGVWLWIASPILAAISIFSACWAYRVKITFRSSVWSATKGFFSFVTLAVVAMLAGAACLIDLVYLTGWEWLFFSVIFLIFPEATYHLVAFARFCINPEKGRPGQ
jgi:phosphatidylglycerophosphate synthase